MLSHSVFVSFFLLKEILLNLWSLTSLSLFFLLWPVSCTSFSEMGHSIRTHALMVPIMNGKLPWAHSPLISHPTALWCVFAFSPPLISQYIIVWLWATPLKLLLPRSSLNSRSPMPFSFNSWNTLFFCNYFICCLLAYLVSLSSFFCCSDCC